MVCFENQEFYVKKDMDSPVVFGAVLLHQHFRTLGYRSWFDSRHARISLERFSDTVSQILQVTGRRNMSYSAATCRNNTRSSLTLNFRHGLSLGLTGEGGLTATASVSMVESRNLYARRQKKEKLQHFNTAGGHLCMKQKKNNVT